MKTTNNKGGLLAIDLDGTLLTDDKKITEANLSGLRKVMDNNITIVIATGRTIPSSREILKGYDFDFYLLSYNGARIIDNKTEEVFSHGMKTENVRKIVNFCIEEKIPLHINGVDYWGITGLNKSVEEFMAERDLESNLIKNVEEIEDMNIINLVAVENVEKVKEFIVTNKIKVNFVNSVPGIMDIMSRNVKKGNGLKKLTQKLGFNNAQIIGIGNYYNDIEMLKSADIGVAMANAPDRVKEYADYVTKNSNNDNGVLEVIEKYIL